MQRIFEIQKFGYSFIASDREFRTPGRVDKLLNTLTEEELELFRRVCSGLPCPREFMRKHWATFGWDEESVNRARIFTPRPLPAPVAYFPTPWRCYENSLRKAREEGIFYVEGLAISPSGPDIHAWNSTDGKNVIDLTWPAQHLNRYLGFVIDVVKYPDLPGTLGWVYHYAEQKRRR